MKIPKPTPILDKHAPSLKGFWSNTQDKACKAGQPMKTLDVKDNPCYTEPPFRRGDY